MVPGAELSPTSSSKNNTHLDPIVTLLGLSSSSSSSLHESSSSLNVRVQSLNGGPASSDLFAGGHTTTTTDEPIIDPSNETITFCKQILFQSIATTGVRVWDVAIFVPNLIFLFFLVYKFKRIRAKLRTSQSPVWGTFYVLVYLITVINIVRCIVSVSLVVSSSAGNIVDKILWLVLRFFLVSAELCVLTFGLFFGHLDNRTSIRRVLVTTVILGFLYSTVQSLLEFLLPANENFSENRQKTSTLTSFTHGGLYFWMVSSALFLVIYGLLALVPCTNLRDKFALPKKRRFYVYCGLLAMLYVFQVAGVALMLAGRNEGMCIVDLTSYIYFALYTPLVYFTFLRGYLAGANRGQLFSYRLQKDEAAVPGDMPPDGGNGSYYYHPTLSGITSPSYDDILQPYSYYDSTDLNSPTADGGPNSLYMGVTEDPDPFYSGRGTGPNPMYNYGDRSSADPFDSSQLVIDYGPTTSGAGGTESRASHSENL